LFYLRDYLVLESRQYYYYYLTPAGIEYLREYLHLPEETIPATLKKPAARPARAGPTPGECGTPVFASTGAVSPRYAAVLYAAAGRAIPPLFSSYTGRRYCTPLKGALGGGDCACACHSALRRCA
jgi:Plectin/S10 domain